MSTTIRQATEDQMGQVRALIEEYARSLEIDLGFQSFDREMAEFPGEYQEPSGCILVAEADDRVVGCVCLRQFEPGICEMKRLYVIPEYHGRGLGRALAQAVIAQAQAMGYERMRLDTLADMHRAKALYLSLGFKECSPYRLNPLPNATFMELVIQHH
jgi:putative acetyltransferase